MKHYSQVHYALEASSDLNSRHSYHARGFRYSAEDQGRIRASIDLMLYILPELCSTKENLRDVSLEFMRTVCRVDNREGFPAVISYLGEIDDLFLKHGDLRRLTDGVTLKVNPFAGVIRRIAFPIRSARALHSLLVCLKKTLITSDETLEETALTTYLAVEEHLRSLPEPDPVLTEEMARVLQEWLRDFEVEPTPRHGNGSNADRVPGEISTVLKYTRLGLDPRLSFMIKDWLHPNVDDTGNFFPLGFNATFERCSKTVFVPKSYKTRRTISMEPVSLMYWQQCIMRSLYKYFEHHKYLRNRIQLQNQQFNRTVARVGSAIGCYATTDLSSASDCVSWRLVQRLFKKTPLWKYLVCTRSTHTVLPTGEIIELQKFAPMGSALCFPIECLIFASLCEVLERRVTARMHMPKTTWSVYGDDIVHPASWTRPLHWCLTNLGFFVNKEKSYSKGPFRESCGGEYLNGVDITPLKFKVPTAPVPMNPGCWQHYVSLANRAGECGLTYVRSRAIDILNDAIEVTKGGRVRKLCPPLFTADRMNGAAIYSPTPTNYRAKARWNENLQRTEYKVCCVRTSRTRDARVCVDDIEAVRLFEWLRDHPLEYTPPQHGTVHRLSFKESFQFPW